MIEVLDLSWNQLNGRGAIAVCTAVRDNGSLRTLMLGWNGLGDAGARAMADSLKSNARLEEVDLSNTHILRQGCEALAQGIAAGKHACVVRLGLNTVGVEGIRALVEAARVVPSLRVLDLHKVPTDEDTHKLITALVTPSLALTQAIASKVGGFEMEGE